MKIFMTGGTGFVGKGLIPELVSRGHHVVLLARNGERLDAYPPEVSVVMGDPTLPGAWQEALTACDGAVNLAGAPIAGRWTREYKVILRQSRIDTTRNLVAALPHDKPFVLFSTSAVGVYGDSGERELDETAPLGNDFLAKVAQDWEKEALAAKAKGVRVVIGRFAVVFEGDGGALPELVKNAKTLRGGPVGSGQQWFSWIHRADLVRAIAMLVEDPDAEGVYNLGSPEPVRQTDLARAVGKAVGIPGILPVPAFLVRLLLGEMADVVLFSQRMSPKRLQEKNFKFLHPGLEESLNLILKS